MNRIKELRIQKELSQQRLGELLNCTDVTISRYESGKRDLDSGTISKLCDVFGCTADYLLGRSDLPSFELSAEEVSLVRAWRACDADTKAGLMLILKPFWQEALKGKAT